MPPARHTRPSLRGLLVSAGMVRATPLLCGVVIDHCPAVEIGRLGVGRVGREGIENMFAHDALGSSSCRSQIRRLRSDDAEFRIDEQAGIGRRGEGRRKVGLLVTA